MSGERFDLEKLPAQEVTGPEPAGLEGRDHRFASYRSYPPSTYGYGYGDEEKANVRRMWRTIRRRKWLILSIVLMVTSLVTVEMFRIKPIYQASTIIEVGKESTTLVRSRDLVVGDDSDPFYQVNIKTKMLMLNSRELHEDVVADLKLDQNPKFLSGDGKGILSRLVTAITGNKSDEETAEPDEIAGQTTYDEPVRSAEEIARLAPCVEALEANLVVEPVRDTRALRVSFTHTSPGIVAAVANGVARNFMQRNFQNKTAKFANTAGWLDSSTRELKAKVEQTEQALANYTRANNIFSLNDNKRDGMTLTTEKLVRLHEQALRAETDRMLKQTLYEELQSGRIADLPEAFTDPKLVELRKQLNELQLSAAQLSVKYSPKNPKAAEVQQQIAAVQAQINVSRKALEAKLRIEYERSLQDERSFKVALVATKGEAVQENQAAIQYNILKQDVDTSRSLYTDFLQKTNQAKAQVAEQHNNIKVIERATIPKKPVGPKRALMILLGFTASLMASVGLVFFLEYLDNTIKTVEDVGRYVQLPALGVIPVIAAAASRKLSKRRNKLITGLRASHARGADKDGELFNPSGLLLLDSRSTAAEAYRALRTSVLLSAAGSPPKTILVTSSQPSEGKTTTVVNTAMSLAQLGAKVLIIDCDLRKPATHKVLGANHARGLSTYLSREVELEGLIQELPIANISLLACGPIPPNPAELISSDKMKNMLASLAQRYDHILIDAPPIINVTDAVILSRMVDGVILVVHGGRSTRDVVRRGRQELESVGAKIFGVVLNNINLSKEGYDNYYYSQYSYKDGEESGS
ncbi:MAG: polysaccharide biosynthesis tyrosine autokinase [Acidobacteriota bacterium]